MYTYISDAIEGMTTIKAMHSENEVIEKFTDTVNDDTVASFLTEVCERWYSIRNNLVLDGFTIMIFAVNLLQRGGN